MKTQTLAHYILFIVLFISFNGNAQDTTKTLTKSNYEVTFYELGSVRCIPCKQMQPVLKSIKEKYKDKVQVIFYDVWTKEGKEAAKNFTFESIPTQLFLDKNGKEFYRHEGFFSEEEIEEVLAKKLIKK